MVSTTFIIMVSAMIAGTIIGAAIPNMSHDGVWMGAVLISFIIMMMWRVIAKFNK